MRLGLGRNKVKWLQAIISVGSLLLATTAYAKDMTFDIIYYNHTNIVVADGDITYDTPAAFQAFLDTNPFDGFNFLIDLNRQKPATLAKTYR